MRNKKDEHNKVILDQFSKQAVPFSQKVPAHSNETAFKLIIETIGINKQDTLLDVACGPGMLSCAAARTARHVTGIDLVPAMIEQARLRQKANNLSNMDWEIGDVSSLPFADSAFSAVMTRFSFHHFLDPFSVLKEMVRVTKPGGKIGVIDVFTTSPAQSEIYNRVEKLRDDSHVKAFSLPELEAMLQQSGLIDIRQQFYLLEIALEQQLDASFPKPGGAQEIRKLVTNDTGGMISKKHGDELVLTYPIAVLAGIKTK